MLISKLLKNKKTIENEDKILYTDLVYNTFNFPSETRGVGLLLVLEDEVMRPDLVCNRVYGDQGLWDALLKYNGISNPFTISPDDLLYGIPSSSISSLYTKPREIPKRGEKTELDINPIVDPKTQKDKNRLSNLNKKKLPPNINDEGDKNVKIKDGMLVFGEDVTTVNKNNCPVPISRSRLQAALLKDKLFI